jgi:hypothetical protein
VHGKDLRAFKAVLMPIAQTIPAIADGQEREKNLKNKAAEGFQKWTKYKKALPRFAVDSLLDASDLKFPDLATAILAGGTGLALASGTEVAIGLLGCKGFQMFLRFREQTSSPYNYLSRIEDAEAALLFPPMAKAN